MHSSGERGRRTGILDPKFHHCIKGWLAQTRFPSVVKAASSSALLLEEGGPRAQGPVGWRGAAGDLCV